MSRSGPREASALTLQMRVFFALLMREMTTRYGKSAGGYIWAVMEPLGAVILLSLVFSAFARNPPLGEHIPMFFATGYMVFHVYTDISAVVSSSVSVNKSLMSFPRVSLVDAVMARFTLQALTTFAVGFIILSVFMVVFPDQIRIDLAPILSAFALAALVGLGVGTMNCVLFAYSTVWQRVFNIVNRPLFLISGIFYLYEDMPMQLQAWLWWNPLVHITALMRSGFYPIYEAAFVSPVYVAVFGAVPLALGLLLLRALRAEILDR
jgi:capsular polysaccharide transport system permease protein